MNTFRKIIALIVIIFIIVPLMFGIVWTVGLTKAFLSPELYSKVPQILISETPEIADSILEDLKERDFNRIFIIEKNGSRIYSEDSKKWFEAIKKADISAKEIMKNSGITSWLENELSESLYKISEILKGKVQTHDVYLDMEQLKNAIKSDYLKSSFLKVIKKLPQCSEDNLEKWKQIYDWEDIDRELPACRPDNEEISRHVINKILNDAAKDIPTEVTLIQLDQDYPVGLNISKVANTFSYFIFIIPFIFIALSSIIADSTKIGFLRWFGGTTLVSGLIPLLFAKFVNSIFDFSDNILKFHVYQDEINTIFQEKINYLINLIISHVFDPVIKVAGVVTIIGLIIFAISFVLHPKE